MYLLWLAVGKSSYSQNIGEEIKPGCRNLQRSQIMVNLKYSWTGWYLNSSLVCRLKDMGWTSISPVEIREGNCYWWDVVICKFLWLVDLSESVFVKKGLGLDQNSGLISVNATWDLSREHWWDLINFESILFLYSLIVCLSKTVK